MVRFSAPYRLAPLLVALLALTSLRPLVECGYEAATNARHAAEACAGHAAPSAPEDAPDNPDARCCTLTAAVPGQPAPLTAPDAPRLDAAPGSILQTGLTFSRAGALPPPDRQPPARSVRLHLVHAVLLI